MAFERFDAHRYMLLTTYRRSGTPVATPVWLVPRGGKLYVWTNRESHKARRLRRDPRCVVAPCNASGKKVLGEGVEASARFLDDADAVPIVEALHARYGWQHALMARINRLRGIRDYVVVELASA